MPSFTVVGGVEMLFWHSFIFAHRQLIRDALEGMWLEGTLDKDQHWNTSRNVSLHTLPIRMGSEKCKAITPLEAILQRNSEQKPHV